MTPGLLGQSRLLELLASVLGMALSIEFGIPRTEAIGASFYIVCAIMIVRGRQPIRMGEARSNAAGPAAASSPLGSSR
jgi:hypothetical protein